MEASQTPGLVCSLSIHRLAYLFDITLTVDAIITFNNGLTVSWGGQPIGVMKLDPVSVVGDVGATLNVQTTFEVANTDYLANFTKVRQI
jgi:hypothetical protein